jgi:hypothetical protein
MDKCQPHGTHDLRVLDVGDARYVPMNISILSLPKIGAFCFVRDLGIRICTSRAWSWDRQLLVCSGRRPSEMERCSSRARWLITAENWRQRKFRPQ